MDNPTVMLLIGPSGVGKTTLVNKMVGEMHGEMALLKPSVSGATFKAPEDWDNFVCISIDDINLWEKQSLGSGIKKLERQAQADGKKLLLILQSGKDLEEAGIKLGAEPAVLRLTGRMESTVFSCGGRHFVYPLIAR